MQNNPDGGVTIGSVANFTSTFAYLSNSGQKLGSSFVSRVNTQTGLEEARYPSVVPLDNNGANMCTAKSPSSCLLDLDYTYFDNAPSRTVVDVNGGVFVANRGQCDWAVCTADIGNTSYNPHNPDSNGTPMVGAVQGSVTYIANRVDHPEQCTPRCTNRKNWNLLDGGAAIFSSGTSLALPDGGEASIPGTEVLMPSPGDGDAGQLAVYAPDLISHVCLDNGAHDPTDVTDPTNYDDCARFSIPLGAPNGYDLKVETTYTDRFAPRGIAISKNCGPLAGNQACDLYVGLTEPAAESSQIIHLGYANNFQVVSTVDTGATNYALYGAAIDCEGLLWAGHGSSRVGLDTSNDSIVSNWAYQDSKGVVHDVPYASDSDGRCSAYGVAVDLAGHVWTAQVSSDAGSNVGACAFDYQHFISQTNLHDGSLTQSAAQAQINSLFDRFGFAFSASPKQSAAGIVVDANNNVYVAFQKNPGVVAFNFAQTGANCGINGDANCLWIQNGLSNVTISTGYGIDLDQNGNPLVSFRSEGVMGLSAVDGTGLPLYGNGTKITGVNGGNDLYTYSDFTGYALQHITQPGGVYEEVFQGCGSGEQTTWATLNYGATVPSGASIYFQLDSADDPAAFTNTGSTGPQILGTWTCNSASSCASPAALSGLPGDYVRITAKLIAPSCSAVSPELDWTNLTYDCSRAG